MKRPTFTNYLRTYRKRAGFSQEEMRFLLGCKDRSNIAKFERSVNRPNIDILFAYQFIFQTDSRALFSHLDRRIQERTIKRVQELIRRLEEVRLAQSASSPARSITRSATQSVNRKISILQSIINQFKNNDV